MFLFFIIFLLNSSSLYLSCFALYICYFVYSCFDYYSFRITRLLISNLNMVIWKFVFWILFLSDTMWFWIRSICAEFVNHCVNTRISHSSTQMKFWNRMPFSPFLVAQWLIAISQNINHVAIWLRCHCWFCFSFHYFFFWCRRLWMRLIFSSFLWPLNKCSKWQWILSLQRNSIYAWLFFFFFLSDRKNNFSLPDVVQWQHQWFSMILSSIWNIKHIAYAPTSTVWSKVINGCALYTVQWFLATQNKWNDQPEKLNGERRIETNSKRLKINILIILW